MSDCSKGSPDLEIHDISNSQYETYSAEDTTDAGPSDWYRRSSAGDIAGQGWSSASHGAEHAADDGWGQTASLSLQGYRQDPSEEEFGSITTKDHAQRTREIPPGLNKRFSTIHPSVSRLRSHMRSVSSSTVHSDRASPPRQRTPSLFSKFSAPSEPDAERRPAFAFHPLRSISASLAKGHRATVMDVRGMIALGIANGAVHVFAFSQELKVILGPIGGDGPVTAIKISPDQTYIAAGYASGNIRLWDLSRPTAPARSTLALPLAQVLNGRREGHLQGSRIVHLGFVGARHTAIISGDEDGRAFWWSLGRVLGVESNDVIRILGNYQSDTMKKSTLFAAAPLPLGDVKAMTDDCNLCALLTPAKLLIVAMKPVPTTAYRRYRTPIGSGERITGVAVWLPVSQEHGEDPVLVYGWGDTIRFLRVKTSQISPKSPVSVEISESTSWKCSSSIEALEMYDMNHLLIFTSGEVYLLDRRSLRAVESMPLQSRLLVTHDFNRNEAQSDVSFRSSVSCYRGKVFMLTLANVQVGSLQHWNERILSRVHQGDFLGAIQVALSYYDGTADSNFIGLPEDMQARRQLVGTRMKDLIKASLDWAFSEERMRDDTHYSADGRGVDLTGLFEGLAVACLDACVSMSDMEFLFDECYERFLSSGIGAIFLRQLEPRVLDSLSVPPRVIKDLMNLHEQDGDFEQAEALIWSVDTHNLDLNQAVRLCENKALWDSLIYVYTRALHDYIAPLAKLLPQATHDIQAVVRIFKYLEATLSGESYPDRGALPHTETVAAKQAVYGFVFAPSTVHWPEGQDGSPIPGESQSYPYLHALARLDLEAFLHSLDVAFEDSFLNDPQGITSRQYITNMLLDLVDSESFSTGDNSLIRIFVARNLPKYPQFLHIPPSALHNLLVGLAADDDQDTREDRQLATEYLLSAYTPQDEDLVLDLFEKAGFWRLLQDAYRREKRWALLLRALIVDPSASETTIDTVRDLVHCNPVTTRKMLKNLIPNLLRLDIRQTALLLDDEVPDIHGRALGSLTDSEKKIEYFQALFEGRQPNVDSALTHQYLKLLLQYDTAMALPFLQNHPSAVDFNQLREEARRARAADIEIWALDQQGLVEEAFQTVSQAIRQRGTDRDLRQVAGIARLAIDLCRKHTPSDQAETIWFTVLHELVDLLHLQEFELDAAQPLRLLIKETLAALMATHGIVFPRLFKRLVDVTTGAPKAMQGRAYSEFRMIVVDMLESYRSEDSLLTVTKKLAQADLYSELERLAACRQRGLRAM